MHNFVYLAKVYEPLVKHEKNLGCSACLFLQSCQLTETKYLKYVTEYMARNSYLIQFLDVFCD